MAFKTAKFDLRLKESLDYDMTYTMRSTGSHQHHMTTSSRSLTISPMNRSINFREHRKYGMDEKMAIWSLKLTREQFTLRHFDPDPAQPDDFKILISVCEGTKLQIQENHPIPTWAHSAMDFSYLPLDDLKDIQVIIPGYKHLSTSPFKDYIESCRKCLTKEPSMTVDQTSQAPAGNFGPSDAQEKTEDAILAFKSRQNWQTSVSLLQIEEDYDMRFPPLPNVPSTFKKDDPSVKSFPIIGAQRSELSVPAKSSRTATRLPRLVDREAPVGTTQGLEISIPAQVPKVNLGPGSALENEPLESSLGAQGSGIPVPANAPEKQLDPLLMREPVKDWSDVIDGPSVPPIIKIAKLEASRLPRPGFRSSMSRTPVAPHSAVVAPTSPPLPPPINPEPIEAVPAGIPQASPVAFRQLLEEEEEDLAEALDLLLEMQTELVTLNDNLAKLESMTVEWQPPADIMDIARAWKKMKRHSRREIQAAPAAFELGIQKMKLEGLVIPQLEAKIAALTVGK